MRYEAIFCLRCNWKQVSKTVGCLWFVAPPQLIQSSPTHNLDIQLFSNKQENSQTAMQWYLITLYSGLVKVVTMLLMHLCTAWMYVWCRVISVQTACSFPEQILEGETMFWQFQILALQNLATNEFLASSSLAKTIVSGWRGDGWKPKWGGDNHSSCCLPYTGCPPPTL